MTLQEIMEQTGIEDEDTAQALLDKFESIGDEEKARDVLEGFATATSGLVRTTRTLRQEIRDMKRKIKDTDGKVNRDDYEALQAKLEELQSQAGRQSNGEEKRDAQNELRALEDRLNKQWQDKLQQKDQEIQSTREQLHATLIDKELTRAIAEVGVADEHRQMVYDAFRHRAKIGEGDDGQSVVTLETPEGLRLSVREFFKDWGLSESGKRYIRAPQNGGGGAPGSRSGGRNGPREITRAEFDKLSASEKADVAHQVYEGKAKFV